GREARREEAPRRCGRGRRERRRPGARRAPLGGGAGDAVGADRRGVIERGEDGAGFEKGRKRHREIVIAPARQLGEARGGEGDARRRRARRARGEREEREERHRERGGRSHGLWVATSVQWGSRARTGRANVQKSTCSSTRPGSP